MSVSFGEAVLTAFEEPTTRQGMVGALRRELARAKSLVESRRVTDAQNVDPKAAALSKVVRAELPIRFVANTPDDIMTALRVAEEFGLDLIIDSGAGAYRVAEALAKAKVPVVVGPSIMGLGGGGPYEMMDHTPENAALLHRAGVRIALSTDSSSGRSVIFEAEVAKSHGLPEEAALKAITLNAAEILGLADRLGSIETGKDADLVVWEGHPLSTLGKAMVVVIDGRIAYQR